MRTAAEEQATLVLTDGLGLAFEPGDTDYLEMPRDVVWKAIADAIRAAIAEEREACAKTVETAGADELDNYAAGAYENAAAAIRART